MSAVGVLALTLVLGAAAPAGESAKERGPGFAFGAIGGLSYTLYPRPSGDLAMFVGVAMPAAARRQSVGRRHLALGYRGELSFGAAEFAPGNEVHRHHLALMGFAGARRRLLLGGGAGVKATFGGGVGVEAAAQIGYAVARREHGSLVVGGQLRLGSWLCDACGVGSFPHFGVFAGWLRLPSRQGPTRAPAAASTRVPPRFVAATTFGLNVGVFPVPSGELSLFLGGTPARSSSRPGHWLAIGYKGAVGYGLADMPAVDDSWPYSTASPFVHRHHVAVQGVAGRRGRLFYGASAGLVVAWFRGSTSDEYGLRAGPGFGVEGEGRLGRLFGRDDSRPRIVGGQLRLTRMFDGGVPLPTLGFFIGGVHGAPTTTCSRGP